MEIKKIWLIGLTILIIGLSSSLGFAKGFQNEPDGFYGIKWGTDIKTIPGMKYLITYENLSIYSRDKDKLFFGNAKVGAIEYIFYKDKFSAVRIHTDGAKEFKTFRDAIFKEYGEGQHPERAGMEKWIWFGKMTDMVLEYNLSNKETIFHMWSVKMEKEIEKE